MFFPPNLEAYASSEFLIKQEYLTLHELLSKKNLTCKMETWCVPRIIHAFSIILTHLRNKQDQYKDMVESHKYIHLFQWSISYSVKYNSMHSNKNSFKKQTILSKPHIRYPSWKVNFPQNTWLTYSLIYHAYFLSFYIFEFIWHALPFTSIHILKTIKRKIYFQVNNLFCFRHKLN